MKRVICYIGKEDMLSIISQFPECELIGCFDMTIQLFDRDKNHLGSIALKDPQQKGEVV